MHFALALSVQKTLFTQTFYSTPADTPCVARANFQVVFNKLRIIQSPIYCDCAICKSMTQRPFQLHANIPLVMLQLSLFEIFHVQAKSVSNSHKRVDSCFHQDPFGNIYLEHLTLFIYNKSELLILLDRIVFFPPVHKWMICVFLVLSIKNPK